MRFGVFYDPWQQKVLDDWMAVDENGKYVHFRNGLEVPRQNGKTAVIEGRIIPGAVLKGEKFLYTAHDYSTVQQLFDRLMYFFGTKANDPFANFPELNRQVRMVRKAIGKEAIFLKNGAIIYLSTRTKSSKLGFTVDVIIIDEAQELTDLQVKAILSTASAAPLGNPQYIFCGTPPTPESVGDTFTHIRKGARTGTATDLSWSEWSVYGLDDLDSVDIWYMTNPGLGVRINESTVRSEYGTYTDPLSFAQMRLGYFLPLPEKGEEVEHLIERGSWEACLCDPPADGELFFSIKFADGVGAVCACLKPDADIAPLYVELVAMRPAFSTVWFEDFAMAVKGGSRRLILDGGGLAESFYNALSQKGYPKAKLRLMRPSDAATAFEGFVSAVNSFEICHMGQTPLADSATKTAKRKIGGKGFGFASTEEAAAAPIEAAAIVHWIAKNTKRREKGGGDLWVW